MGLVYFEQTIMLSANETREVPLRGRTASILDLTGTVKMRVDHSEQTNIRKGVKFRVDDHFDKLEFQEIAGSTATIVIAVSEGDIDDNRLTITSTINQKSGDTLGHNTVTVGAAATQIVAADVNRNDLAVVNTHATDTLYLGGAAVTAGNGIPVLPGGSFSIPSGAALYGIRGGANNIDVRYMEIKN